MIFDASIGFADIVKVSRQLITHYINKSQYSAFIAYFWEHCAKYRWCQVLIPYRRIIKFRKNCDTILRNGLYVFN